MSCRETEEKLLGGLETRMDPAVWTHLRNCRSCRELQKELEEIEDLHRTLASTEKAPLDFAGRVIPRISWSYRLRTPLIAAGMALVALLAATFFAAAPAENSAAVATNPASRVPTYEGRPVEFNLDYPQTQIFVLDSTEQTESEKVVTRKPRKADRVENGLLRYVSH